MRFFDDKLFLHGKDAAELYETVKDLPIIDYHCHLNARDIAENSGFADIGEMWLKGDHYKWRAMRLCGVKEKYITGDASWYEKFTAYAGIMPKLIGNPLYYWTHLELKNIFGINIPLCAENAAAVWDRANEVVKNLKVSDLLDKFRVEYIATTDDPADSLEYCGKYGNTVVAPTFRPDKAFSLSGDYLKKLSDVSGENAFCFEGFFKALVKRLDFFCSAGCRISDHGFGNLRCEKITADSAANIFARGEKSTEDEKQAFFLYGLEYMAAEYKKRKMAMQLHFSAFRNVNSYMFSSTGADSGFDVIGEEINIFAAAAFLDRLNSAGALPKTVLYSLNPQAVKKLAVLSGAFPNVFMGAAWWFNDTVEGIRKQLSEIAEYAVLGTSLGMLTDSRSFASYVRFDFFRRILCGYVGGLTEKGEYSMQSAAELVKDICCNNIKEFLNL